MSHRLTYSLKTACASASHCGWPAGGLGKLFSAADMAAMAQNPWSSFPSVLVWLSGWKSLLSPTWWIMACVTTSLYVVSLVKNQ